MKNIKYSRDNQKLRAILFQLSLNRSMSPYQNGKKNPDFINPTFISNAFDFLTPKSSTDTQQNRFSKDLFKSYQSEARNRSYSSLLTQAQEEKQKIDNQIKYEQSLYQQDQKKLMQNLTQCNRDISMKRLNEIVREDQFIQRKFEDQYNSITKSIQKVYTEELDKNIEIKKQQQQKEFIENQEFYKLQKQQLEIESKKDQIQKEIQDYKKKQFNYGIKFQIEHRKKIKELQQRNNLQIVIQAQEQTNKQRLQQEQERLRRVKQNYIRFT
ncbi:hypothetical protein pb186bvf_011266 [Paramecium bursaria]